MNQGCRSACCSIPVLIVFHSPAKRFKISFLPSRNHYIFHAHQPSDYFFTFITNRITMSQRHSDLRHFLRRLPHIVRKPQKQARIYATCPVGHPVFFHIYGFTCTGCAITIPAIYDHIRNLIKMKILLQNIQDLTR